MYECPNCGGNLKFEISSQKLYCAFCDTRLEPASVTKEADTLENDSFEVNVFLCPQCGGEMISGDNDATAFCSYCGAANILSTRLSREKRPKYIIPFSKTKEDCKKAYAQKLRKAIFAPKALKDSNFIDSFRGIYMPYWLYHFTQKGPVAFKGKRTKTKGNYLYTDHYKLTADLDAESQGLSHDASAAFYDSISQELAPFDTRNLKPFTPSYLSGFYADVPDLAADSYLADATDTVNQNTAKQIKHHTELKSYDVALPNGNKSLNTALNTKCESMDSAMYPVWFLSWQNQGRVAYAAVNGQTGKVAMDIPIDSKKYLIGSLLLAVPIFLILNLFLTLRPSVLMILCAVLSMTATEIWRYELDSIHMRETHANDKGIKLSKKQQKSDKAPKKQKNSSVTPLSLRLIFLWLLCLFTALFLSNIASRLIWPAAIAGTAYICISGLKMKGPSQDTKGGLSPAAVLASVGAATLTGLIRPVSDLWYYGCVLLMLASVILCITDIIRNFNRLATYRLPQFDKKGGEDNA